MFGRSRTTSDIILNSVWSGWCFVEVEVPIEVLHTYQSIIHLYKVSHIPLIIYRAFLLHINYLFFKTKSYKKIVPFFFSVSLILETVIKMCTKLHLLWTKSNRQFLHKFSSIQKKVASFLLTYFMRLLILGTCIFSQHKNKTRFVAK